MSTSEPTAYRPCVGIMLVNESGQVFTGRRIDARGNPDGKDYWQMPQGGVDPGEDWEVAAFRELEEETGVSADNASIIAKTTQPIRYDLPDELIGKLWKGKYRGQEQIWFLMRFTGSDEDIDLNAHDPAEFNAWKWVEAESLPLRIIPFKQALYEKVLKAFRGEL